MSLKNVGPTRYITWGLCAVIVTLLAGHLMTQSSADENGKSATKKLLRHMVLYQFKPEISDKQVQEVVEAFAALPKKIDSIVGFERGVNVSEENKSEGFTHCFVVTFRDLKGRETYLKHPAHDEYVKVVKDRRQKVIVFDYWTEE